MGRFAVAVCMSLLGLASAGCAASPPRMHANEILARADQDPVRFYNDYRGKRIVVLGHVGAKGLVTRRRMQVEMVDFGPVITGGVKNDRDVLATLAFDPSRRVVCYFPNSELDAVAAVDVGARIVVDCRIAGVEQIGGQYLVQLNRCELAER